MLDLHHTLFIEKRIIMTPGPVEADPRVLRAMTNPIIHLFDPEFTQLMDDTMSMTRKMFNTSNKNAFAINGSARAGIEALLGSIIEKGTKVYIPIAGRFGHLLAEIAKRAKGHVKTSEVDMGFVHPFASMKAQIDAFNPDIVAVVHGESSTGTKQPLKNLGEYCQENNILFVVDGVATLLGEPFEMDAWNIDAAVTGSQKCLSAPAGMSLIAYNHTVEKVINRRKKIDQGLDKTSENPDYITSNYLDLSQLQAYWSEDRLNHHTEATSMLYAIHEALRLTLLEGVEQRINRHAQNMRALKSGLNAMGLSFFEDQAHALNTITCVNIPSGLDIRMLKKDLVKYYGIEIASGFGPLKNKVFRVGAMGYSSRRQNILIFLNALESLLLRYGIKINANKAFDEAMKHYD